LLGPLQIYLDRSPAEVSYRSTSGLVAYLCSCCAVISLLVVLLLLLCTAITTRHLPRLLSVAGPRASPHISNSSLLQQNNCSWLLSVRNLRCLVHPIPFFITWLVPVYDTLSVVVSLNSGLTRSRCVTSRAGESMRKRLPDQGICGNIHGRYMMLATPA
jgi:hypothetical protein